MSAVDTFKVIEAIVLVLVIIGIAAFFTLIIGVALGSFLADHDDDHDWYREDWE